MENGFVNELLAWVTANPGWSGALLFLIAFTESLVIVGIFLPGILH